MLRTLNTIKGNKIRAIDGEIGSVDYFFFDDDTWTIRYLVINTGNWLTGRQVLISPYSISSIDGIEGIVNLSITKEQVEQSPTIDVLQPISRLQEAAFLNYYDYPYYWDATEVWGASPYPMLVREASAVRGYKSGEQRELEHTTASRLRSTETITGYHLAATDGDIGHISGVVIDDESWVIHYVIVDTQNWWPGKKVTLSPRVVTSFDKQETKIHINLTREEIKRSPEFSEITLHSREYGN